MTDHLHVDLGGDLGQRFHAVMPPRLKSSIVRALVDALVTDVEESGPGIIGIVLDKSFNLRKHLLK